MRHAVVKIKLKPLNTGKRKKCYLKELISHFLSEKESKSLIFNSAFLCSPDLSKQPNLNTRYEHFTQVGLRMLIGKSSQVIHPKPWFPTDLQNG